LVAVSQRVDVWADRNERRDALDQRLCEWLLQADCLPVPVPNVVASSGIDRWWDAIGPAAVLLSGGNDIDQMQYRDQTERCLLRRARTEGAPVLGICRGMQMLATESGARLEPVSGHVQTRHSMPTDWTQHPRTVNSYHNLALPTCPPDYEPLATAEDGTVEAIRHRQLPWEGWMWHPEREQVFEPSDLGRLRDVFQLAEDSA
jgi:putative glutamine amidotransferase